MPGVCSNWKCHSLVGEQRRGSFTSLSYGLVTLSEHVFWCERSVVVFKCDLRWLGNYAPRSFLVQRAVFTENGAGCDRT